MTNLISGPLFIIVANEIIDCFGQYFFKRSTAGVAISHFHSAPEILAALLAILSSGYFWIGLAAITCVFIVWCAVLSKYDLSLAMPLTSVNYIFVALSSLVFLNEKISSARWVGIALILVGVAMVSTGEAEPTQIK